MTLRETPLLLIGLTTGRAGSKSLASFLDKQPGIDFTHEGYILPFWPVFDTYEFAHDGLKRRLDTPGALIVGDISPYWVNYADRIVKDFDNVKFLRLDRENPDQVVTSFDAYKRYEEQAEWWGNYPILDKHYSVEAIRRTIKLMLWLLGCCEAQWGHNMAGVMMHHLSDQRTQKGILDWLKYPEEGRVYGMPRENLRVDMIKRFKSERVKVIDMSNRV